MTTAEIPSKIARTAPNNDQADLPMKRRRHQRKSSKPRRDTRKSRFDPSYTGPDERKNTDFEEYYRAQNIVADEEFSTLLETLATPLPTSFRVIANGPFRQTVMTTVQGQMTDLLNDVIKSQPEKLEKTTTAPGKPKVLSPDDNVAITPLRQIPWYPDGLAWCVSAPRQLLRRDNVLSPFHKFIVNMNTLGAINRQEAVSMIPTLMLDVHNGHSVLDMCAAPGSKTAQIVEALSIGKNRNLSDGGVVIANDADLKRCWMLGHQLKRFASPELIITNHEAQHFPMVMAFDRVLCDVPCSGDGTLRKAPDIWKRWNANMGISLHRIQKQIAERGIDLLKPGGRMVYSTCSFNPLENEAVVSHLLREYGEGIELLDCSKDLPDLKRRSGLRTWRVKNNSGNVESKSRHEQTFDPRGDNIKSEVEIEQGNDQGAGTNAGKPDEKAQENRYFNGEWFRTYDDVRERRRSKIVESLFPPSEEELASGKFPLERCMRLIPHDQDTGGFFVAVFQKAKSAVLPKRLQKRMEEQKEVMDSLKRGTDTETEKVGEKERTQKETSNVNIAGLIKQLETEREKSTTATRLIADDALVGVGVASPETLEAVRKFFGIEDDLGERYMMTRGGDHESFRKIVVVSRTVRSVLRHGIGTRNTEVAAHRRVMRIVNAGVRVLERTDRKESGCGFRLIHEGIALMRGLMSKRVLAEGVDAREMVILLKEKQLSFQSRIAESQGTEFWERVKGMGSGSAVIVCDGEEVIVWVGQRNVTVVMADEIVAATLMRLGHGDGLVHKDIKEKNRACT